MMNAATKARKKTASKTAQRPSGPAQRRAMVRTVDKTAVPRQLSVNAGATEFLAYAAALADPFNAMPGQGIPMGSIGFPTFKTTRVLRYSQDSVPLTVALSPSNLGAWAVGTHHSIFEIYLSSAGACSFEASNAFSNGTTATLRSTGVTDAPRLVAAAIRIRRMGRADDRGLKYVMTRTCYDGTEAFADFTSGDEIQMNYVPKSNWDLEYKLSVAAHPTNFTTSIKLFVAATVPSTFMVDYVAIVESNDDTPPANDWTVGDYQNTVSTRTRDSALLPEHLGTASNYAASGAIVRRDDANFDPSKKDRVGFFKGIENAARGVEKFIGNATGAALGIKNAYSAYESAALVLAL